MHFYLNNDMLKILFQFNKSISHFSSITIFSIISFSISRMFISITSDKKDVKKDSRDNVDLNAASDHFHFASLTFINWHLVSNSKSH